MAGEAASYHNGPPEGQQKMQYQQPPPNYGQNYNAGPPPPNTGDYGKQTFEQTFKLDKPKYNDLWAGILVLNIPSSLQCPVTSNAPLNLPVYSLQFP